MKRWFLLFVLLLAIGVTGLNEAVLAQNLEVKTEVDRQPKFKGKPSKPEKFFERHLSYPEEARLKMIEGVVDVSFLVSEDGKLIEPDIEKGVDPLLDNEALRVVSKMEEWRPAKKDGDKVDARVVLSVPFRLSEDEKALMETFHEYGLTEEMPLFVIDDKIVNTYVEIPEYNVKSVRVMKGEKAVDRFGEKARNGVVIITTKRGTPPVR
ncbi:MAG: TonB family protein [Marinilabiliaceae bacterium]